MAFERRQPSVDLRAFLDPLKPGQYFDCGRARLYGIDEALEAEALRRGRAVGDDEFQLVATDGGLIFCRASIMFAIAARWKDLTIGRPEDGNRPAEVLLPISWPTHGDLQFTVSRRLGSNIFRRWLQLQAQATRRTQVEQDGGYEYAMAPGAEAPANGHSHHHRHPDVQSGSNGHVGNEPSADDRRERNGHSVSPEAATADHAENIDLRDGDARCGEPDRRQDDPGAIDHESAEHPHRNGNGSTSAARVPDPLATLDAAVVDEWVDDRVPHRSEPGPIVSRSPGPSTVPRRGPITAFFDGDETADPFDGHELGVGDGDRRPGERDGDGDVVRFDVRPAGESELSPEAGGQDATATQFMRRTVDGTEIFPGDRDERRQRGARDRRRQPRNGHVAMPVPEISGARLQVVEPPDPGAGPRLDIRSTLLSGHRESDLIELLRRRQVLILGLASIAALALIALIGFLAGGEDDGNTVAAIPPTADAGAEAGAATVGSDRGAGTEGVDGSSTTVTVPGVGADQATIDSTAPTLRVSSTSVQICHSNYGGCVPVAADVDCEGDGDGPAFQTTPVAVFGDDVYELDTDGDREACEPDQPRLDAADGGG